MKASYILFTVCSLFIGTSQVLAQSGAPGQTSGMDFALLKLFGGHAAFTAKADIEVSGGAGPGDMSMTANLAVLDGKMRTEVDMTQLKSKEMPPQAMEQMKQMGMDRVVNITLAADRKMLIIFPNMKSYITMPIPDKSAKILSDKGELEKTELGKETVDGHPCVKNKILILGEDGAKHAFTVWNATDLKDFPVRFESRENGGTVRGAYRDIQFVKPAAKLFEAPAGFKAYAGMQEMMMSVMQQMMPQGMPTADGAR